MDISGLKIPQLLELIEAAQARVEQLRKSEKAEVRARIVAMAKEAGFDAYALLSGKSEPASHDGERVRRPAKAKYLDPVSGKTWTGRGLQPKWMTAALASGETREAFLIK